MDYRGWAGNTDRGYMKYAVCDRHGPRTVQCEALVPGVNRAGRVARREIHGPTVTILACDGTPLSLIRNSM